MESMQEVCSHAVLTRIVLTLRQLVLLVLVSKCEKIPLGVGTFTSKERKKKATELSICFG